MAAPYTRSKSKLPYGMKQASVEAVVYQLRQHENETWIGANAVYSAFDPDVREAWSKAYGRKRYILSNITSCLWQMAQTHSWVSPMGKGQYRLAPADDDWRVVMGGKPKAETLPQPDGIHHLRVVGVDNDGNTLYLDPANNVVGTIEFKPLGKSV